MPRKTQHGPSPDALMTEARQNIERLGIGGTVEPETWVVGYSDTRRIDDIATSVLLRNVENEFALDHPHPSVRYEPVPEDAARIAAAQEAYSLKAQKGLLPKALAWGALTGIAVGAYATVSIGETKDQLRDAFEQRPPHVEGEIFENNVLTADKFITFDVGDKKVTIPDVSTLSYGEIMAYEVNQTLGGIATSDTTEQLARNPLAADLKLTGLEGEIDHKVATELLEGIDGKDLKITSVQVHGIASDDLNGKIGEIDPEQAPLAKARAEVAVAALKTAAKEQEIALPKDITVTSGESLISKTDVAAIERALKVHGMTMREALDQYDGGGDLPKDVKELLDTHIQRGATYDVGFERTITSTDYKLQPKGTEEDSWKPWMTFALSGGMTGYLATMAGAVTRLRRAPRRGSKLARKDINRAAKAKAEQKI